MKSVPKHPVSPKPETDPNACSKHANSSLEYFCKRCEIFICKQCWKSEHKNSSDHDVVLLSMIQEEYQDIKTLVEVYKNPIQKCSKAVMKGERALSELMAETEDTVKRLDSISTESSARKILKESKEIYSVLDGHINYLQLIKEELMENISVHFDGADYALRMAVGQMGELTLLEKHDKPEDTPNSKVLHHTGLSMAVKRCYEIPLEGCKKAVIDSKGTIFCFGDYLEQLFLCRSSLENDQMIFKEAFPWTSRKDGTILTNICMASGGIAGNVFSKAFQFFSQQFFFQKIVLSLHSFHLNSFNPSYPTPISIRPSVISPRKLAADITSIFLSLFSYTLFSCH